MGESPEGQTASMIEYAQSLKKKLEQELGLFVEVDLSGLAVQMEKVVQTKPILEFTLHKVAPNVIGISMSNGSLKKKFFLSECGKALDWLKIMQSKYADTHQVALKVMPSTPLSWKLQLAQAGWIAEKLNLLIRVSKKYKHDAVVVRLYDLAESKSEPILLAEGKLSQAQLDDLIAAKKQELGSVASHISVKIDPGAANVLSGKASQKASPKTKKGKAEPAKQEDSLTPGKPDPASPYELLEKLSSWLEKVKAGAFPKTPQGALAFAQAVKKLAAEVAAVFSGTPDMADPVMKKLWELKSEAAKATNSYFSWFVSAGQVSTLQAVAAVMDIQQLPGQKLMVPTLVSKSLPYWLNKFYPDQDSVKGLKPPLKHCKAIIGPMPLPNLLEQEKAVVALVEDLLGPDHAKAVAEHLCVHYDPTLTTKPTSAISTQVQPDQQKGQDAEPESASPTKAKPEATHQTAELPVLLPPAAGRRIVNFIPTATVLPGMPSQLPIPFAELPDVLRAQAILAAEAKAFQQRVRGPEFWARAQFIIDQTFEQAIAKENKDLQHGHHPKVLAHWVEPDGTPGPPVLMKWKRHSDPLGMSAAAEEAANEVARRVGLPAVEVRRVRVVIDGKPRWVSAQPLVVQMSEIRTLDEDVTKWTPLMRLAVMRHHMVDMLVGDHDSHFGNWILVNGIPMRIDRGQAGKFLGTPDDRVALDCNPSPPITGNIRMPVANYFYSKVKAKEIPLSASEIRNSLIYTLDAIESIPDDEYREIWRKTGELAVQEPDGIRWIPEARQRAKQKKAYPTNEDLVEAYLDMQVEKKHRLRQDFEAFFSDVLGHPFKF